MARIPPPRNAPSTVYHELLLVSEKDLEQFKEDQTRQVLTDFPNRYCILKSGSIRMWPVIDPKKMRLFFTVAE